MNVFALLVGAMHGVQLIGVCPTREQAEGYLNDIAFGSDPRVQETIVYGDLAEPNIVYTAERYNKKLDAHYFAGVYGNFVEARRAAGPNGLILARKLKFP